MEPSTLVGKTKELFFLIAEVMAGHQVRAEDTTSHPPGSTHTHYSSTSVPTPTPPFYLINAIFSPSAMRASSSSSSSSSRVWLGCLSGERTCQSGCPGGRWRTCWTGSRTSIPATPAHSKKPLSNTPYQVQVTHRPSWKADDDSGLTLKRAFHVHVRPPGRALLRLRDHHLGRLGLDGVEQLQDVLQDLLLLRVQEEISELEDLGSGEEAHLSPPLRSATRSQPALSALQTVVPRNRK